MSRKNSALLRIVLYSLALVILVGGSLALYFYSTKHTIGSETITEYELTDLSSGTFSAQELDSIEINWASGRISLSPNDRLTDTITVREVAPSEDTRKMNLKHSGRTLQIDFAKTPIKLFGISTFADATKDLYIEVPSDWYCEELVIDSASTPVHISHMEIEEVEFNLASGDLNMDACKVKSLTVDAASGTLNFNGELQELECDAASADCNIHLSNSPKKIECNSASGDLVLSLPEDCGFSCEQNGLNVDFNSDFPTTIQDSRHVYGNGSCQINFDTLSGSLSIYKLVP